MKIFSYIAQIACLVLYLVQFCVVQFRFIWLLQAFWGFGNNLV